MSLFVLHSNLTNWREVFVTCLMVANHKVRNFDC